MKKRLAPEKRKQSILEAALPLFAKEGFHGTSTRQIAKSAGVSDALLYKYFKSKAAIYEGLIDIITAGAETAAREKLLALPLNVDSLAKSIYFLMYVIVYGIRGVEPYKKMIDRLLTRSLASDGAMISGFHKSKLDPWVRHFQRFHDAAIASNDIYNVNIPFRNIYWFIHHVGFSMLICKLPKIETVCYEGDEDEAFSDATKFVMLGTGIPHTTVEEIFNMEEELKTYIRTELFSTSKV